MATLLQLTQKERLDFIQTRISQYGIRFPVASIAEKTGFDKGNVSAILKGKKPISDNFFTTFLEAYPEKLIASGPGPNFEAPPLLRSSEHDPSKINSTSDIFLALIAEKERVIKEKENRRVEAESYRQEAKEEKDKLFLLIDKLQRIIENQLSNLDNTAQTILRSQRAEHAVIMNGIDHLQKNKPGTLAKGAGKLELKAKRAQTKTGTKAVQNR